jgi:hypothetical protein
MQAACIGSFLSGERMTTCYVDRSGKSWPVDLTIGKLEEVLAIEEIDLEALFMQGDNGKIADLLYRSARKFARVFAIVCGVPEAEQKAFIGAMGQSQITSARELLMGSIARFCLPPKAAEKFVGDLPTMLAGEIKPSSGGPGSNQGTGTAESLAKTLVATPSDNSG